jgi:hypothetical protein
MHTTTSFGAVPREMIALFDNENELNDAVEDLQIVGFERSGISVSPPWKRAERQIGRQLASAVELADALDAPHSAPVDPASFGVAQGACIAGPLYVFSCSATIMFAAGGAALATIAVAAIVAGVMGAAVGLLPVIWLRRSHNLYVQDLLARGGLVLWVNIADQKCEQRARLIFARHAAHDVHNNSVAA